MTTIYAVLRPDVEVCLSNIRYVGLTKKTLESRLAEHIYECQIPRKNKSHRTKWFKSLVDEGIYPVVYPLETVSPEDASLCEQRWIGRLRQLGCDLVNGTIGGETGELTPEAREKVAAASRGRPGRIWTVEQRVAVSAAVSASIKLKYDTDPEYRARQLEGCRRRAPISPETRKKMNAGRKPGINKGHHTRWHVGKGVTVGDCEWCVTA